jgi:hypothetical protein
LKLGSSLSLLSLAHWRRLASVRKRSVKVIFLLGDPSNPLPGLGMPLWGWWHVLCQVLVVSSDIHYRCGFQTICQPSHGNK